MKAIGGAVSQQYKREPRITSRERKKDPMWCANSNLKHEINLKIRVFRHPVFYNKCYGYLINLKMCDNYDLNLNFFFSQLKNQKKTRPENLQQKNLSQLPLFQNVLEKKTRSAITLY